MFGNLYYVSTALMIFGLWGFAPGFWWAWSISILTVLFAMGFVVLLSFADPSKLLEHPDPTKRSAVKNAVASVTHKTWLPQFIALGLVVGYAATGHLWLSIVIGLSSALVLFAGIKAQDAITQAS